MGKVFKSPYRQPPTPEGLHKIESGTMEWFDIEMYSNFNTGVLEQYFEEKNKSDGFCRSTWTWERSPPPGGRETEPVISPVVLGSGSVAAQPDIAINPANMRILKIFIVISLAP